MSNTLFTPLPMSGHDVINRMQDGDELYDLKKISPLVPQTLQNKKLGYLASKPQQSESDVKKLEKLRHKLALTERALNNEGLLLHSLSFDSMWSGLSNEEKLKRASTFRRKMKTDLEQEIKQLELVIAARKQKKQAKEKKKQNEAATVVKTEQPTIQEIIKNEMKPLLDNVSKLTNKVDKLTTTVDELTTTVNNLKLQIGKKHAGNILHDRVSGVRDGILLFVNKCCSTSYTTISQYLSEKGDDELAHKLYNILPIISVLDTLKQESSHHRNRYSHPQHDPTAVLNLTTILCQPQLDETELHQKALEVMYQCACAPEDYNYRKEFTELVFWLRTILDDTEFQLTKRNNQEFVATKVYEFLDECEM